MAAPPSPLVAPRVEAAFASPVTGDRMYYWTCSPAAPRGVAACFHGLLCHANMPEFHALARECMAQGLAFAA